MDDLIAFINARLDELALAAEIAAVDDAWQKLRQSIPREPGTLNRCHRLMEEANPDRVLREVAARRAMIERYRDAVDTQGEYRADGSEYVAECMLKCAASAWSDHPGYRQEWAS